MSTVTGLFHEESEMVKCGTGMRLDIAAEFEEKFTWLPRVGEYVYTGTEGGRVFDVKHTLGTVVLHVWRQGAPYREGNT